MKTTIIDYGSGNIQSVEFALNRLGVTPILTKNTEEILSSDFVIFPGVGEASSAMRQLKQYQLDTLIPNLKQPVLGICLGMQLMCSYSDEGESNGLDIFPVRVKRFSEKVKVPQIGWNTINKLKSPLFKGVENGSFMYFVHSYYVPTNEYSIATTNYDIDYSSAMKKNNFLGCQFHPEKSADTGAKIIQNFLTEFN